MSTSFKEGAPHGNWSYKESYKTRYGIPVGYYSWKWSGYGPQELVTLTASFSDGRLTGTYDYKDPVNNEAVTFSFDSEGFLSGSGKYMNLGTTTTLEFKDRMLIKEVANSGSGMEIKVNLTDKIDEPDFEYTKDSVSLSNMLDSKLRLFRRNIYFNYTDYFGSEELIGGDRFHRKEVEGGYYYRINSCLKNYKNDRDFNDIHDQLDYARKIDLEQELENVVQEWRRSNIRTSHKAESKLDQLGQFWWLNRSNGRALVLAKDHLSNIENLKTRLKNILVCSSVASEYNKMFDEQIERTRGLVTVYEKKYAEDLAALKEAREIAESYAMSDSLVSTVVKDVFTSEKELNEFLVNLMKYRTNPNYGYDASQSKTLTSGLPFVEFSNKKEWFSLLKTERHYIKNNNGYDQRSGFIELKRSNFRVYLEKFSLSELKYLATYANYANWYYTVVSDGDLEPLRLYRDQLNSAEAVYKAISKYEVSPDVRLKNKNIFFSTSLQENEYLFSHIFFPSGELRYEHLHSFLSGDDIKEHITKLNNYRKKIEFIRKVNARTEEIAGMTSKEIKVINKALKKAPDFQSKMTMMGLQ